MRIDLKSSIQREMVGMARREHMLEETLSGKPTIASEVPSLNTFNTPATKAPDRLPGSVHA